MAGTLSQGSLWRRWDPHVHLPGTLFNDQFGTTSVDEAMDALGACEPRIEAIGVTDYYSTASFHRAVQSKANGHAASIDYIFPNVELRLDIPTRDGKGVNLHIVTDANHVDLLDRLLQRLTFTYRDVQYQADEAGLIRLGRTFAQNQQLDGNVALRGGAGQFKINFAQLRELFQADSALREHCLIGVAVGETDGTSGVRSSDGGFAAIRQSLERFANFIFSGQEGQREFWLGRGPNNCRPSERDTEDRSRAYTAVTRTSWKI